MRAAIGVLLALMAFAGPAMASERPRLQVRIAPERDVALDASDLKAIASDVRRIWAPVLDVIVTWPSDVSRPVVVDSIPLVLTARTLSGGDSGGLGWIAFAGDEPQPEITVSVTVAQRMLQNGAWRGRPFSSLPPRASRLFMQRAVARASAHEIGHYLLRSRAHSHRGLMRAAFTAASQTMVASFTFIAHNCLPPMPGCATSATGYSPCWCAKAACS